MRFKNRYESRRSVKSRKNADRPAIDVILDAPGRSWLESENELYKMKFRTLPSVGNVRSMNSPRLACSRNR